MIEELKMLQEIVGDLSGVGLYIALGYMLMKLLFMCGWIYIAKIVIEKLYSFFTCDVKQSDWNAMKDNNESLRRDLENNKYKRKMEVEDLKHMYKILKEKHNDTK